MDKVAEVRVPRENVNDETVSIIRWLVADGQKVRTNEPLVEVETTKTNFAIEAPLAGYVKIISKESEEVDIGAVLCYVGESLDALEKNATTIRDATTRPEETPGDVRFSARALQLIEQKSLDRAVFSGRSLVREKDVLGYLNAEAARAGRDPAAMEIDGESSSAAAGVPVESERLSRSKRLEIRYLRAANSTTLPSSVTVSVPTRLISQAAARNPEILSALSAAIIFETSRLLRKYREFNAYYADGHVNLYQEINIGFVIDADNGLKVPVIHNADTKSIEGILAEKRDLFVDYVENTLRLESLAGGTITVSDLSGEGVTSFTPLLNQGQSAILGVGSEVVPPGAHSGTYNLILVFDHQVAAGRQAAKFLNELRGRLVAHEESLLQAVETGAVEEEPYCSFCLKPLSELQAIDCFLLHTVGGPDRGNTLVCESCMQGW